MRNFYLCVLLQQGSLEIKVQTCSTGWSPSQIRNPSRLPACKHVFRESTPQRQVFSSPATRTPSMSENPDHWLNSGQRRAGDDPGRGTIPRSIVVHQRGLQKRLQNLSWMSSLILHNSFLLRRRVDSARPKTHCLYEAKSYSVLSLIISLTVHRPQVLKEEDMETF